MTSKILKSILSVAVAVLLATLLVITGVLYQYFGGVQQSQLKDELSLAASATEQLGEKYLETLSSDRYRLTWVAPDGTVLFDTRADAAAMENHADREEIKEAMTSGTGSSSRNSATLTEQTIYEATRLEDGSVLRISVSRATALVLVLGMIQPLAAIALAAIALSAWLAHRMAKRVVEPLNKLDLDKPMDNDAYEELSPLASERMQVLGFTDRVATYMSAADLYITKPGGLTTSESIAKRLPMVLIEAVPGLETRNYDFLIGNGVAIGAKNWRQVTAVVQKFMRNAALGEKQTEAMKRFTTHNSAELICKHVLQNQ